MKRITLLIFWTLCGLHHLRTGDQYLTIEKNEGHLKLGSLDKASKFSFVYRSKSQDTKNDIPDKSNIVVGIIVNGKNILKVNNETGEIKAVPFETTDANYNSETGYEDDISGNISTKDAQFDVHKLGTSGSTLKNGDEIKIHTDTDNVTMFEGNLKAVGGSKSTEFKLEAYDPAKKKNTVETKEETNKSSGSDGKNDDSNGNSSKSSEILIKPQQTSVSEREEHNIINKTTESHSSGNLSSLKREEDATADLVAEKVVEKMMIELKKKDTSLEVDQMNEIDNLGLPSNIRIPLSRKRSQDRVEDDDSQPPPKKNKIMRLFGRLPFSKNKISSQSPIPQGEFEEEFQTEEDADLERPPKKSKNYLKKFKDSVHRRLPFLGKKKPKPPAKFKEESSLDSNEEGYGTRESFNEYGGQTIPVPSSPPLQQAPPYQLQVPRPRLQGPPQIYKGMFPVPRPLYHPSYFPPIYPPINNGYANQIPVH